MTESTNSEAGGLVAADLGMTYGGAGRALDGIDLVVPEGAVVALLGPNGAGKTSVLRAISGNLRRYRAHVTGTLAYRGESLLGLDPAQTVRRGVVQVPEGRRIFSSLTVAENLQVGGLVQRSGAERRRTEKDVLDLFPILHDRRSQTAGLLSGGEQQMLAMGRAMMASPTLLLLDEPSLGLAPKVISAVAGAIQDINATGTSVLLIEQNASVALSVAQHAYVLSLGRVEVEGSTEDPALMADAQRLYLGTSGKGSAEQMHTPELGAVPAGSTHRTLAPWPRD